MNKATLRSREQLLKFVYGFGKKLKTPPVMFDDRSRRGVIPPSVVEYNLNRLVRYGLLVREPDGWVVPEDVSQRQMPPRIGAATSLPTGTPMPAWGLTASSQEFDTVEVSPELVEKFGQLFALRVIGTGMIDALIDDGDVVVIKPARCVKDGEIIVAWFIKEETTILRKFYREGDYVRLQPANSTMGPIYALKENIEVRGKVVSVIRALG
jgi:repressor LexA